MIEESKKQKEREEIAQEFWKQLEREAAELEITVDYLLMEFY